MWSFDFAEIAAAQERQAWDLLADKLASAAKKLEEAGAEAILICSNTMHKVAPAIASSVAIPVLHIVDAIGERLQLHGCTSVGLLGSSYTMEQSFYREHLKENYGIRVFTPEPEQRELINRIIFSELCQGIVKNSSRDYSVRVIDDLQHAGASGVVLGCTEIGMLIQPQDDRGFPILDSTAVHVAYALDWLESHEHSTQNTQSLKKP